jgi:hypothetical protein
MNAPLREITDMDVEEIVDAPYAGEEPPPPLGPQDYGLNGHVVDRQEEPPRHPDFSGAVLRLSDWLERDTPEPDFLLGSWLSTTTRCLSPAATGLGKTNFWIAVGMAIAAGTGFLHWQGRRHARVLYIDGEMSRRLLKKRLAAEVRRLGFAPETFFAFSHEDIEDFAPLNTQAGQSVIDALVAHLGGVDLIIFDSVMCLTAGDMKDEESWSQTLPWVRKLTRASIGQVWIHHTGHDETRSYGTKTREWQLDLVAFLEAVERADTDVSFCLRFTKARERTPDTRADFQDVRVALVLDQWQHDAKQTQRSNKVSPLGLKFLAALNDALSGDTATKVNGRAAVGQAEWWAECVRAGLIDPDAKPTSARTLYYKYRRELIGANRIACAGDLQWTL